MKVATDIETDMETDIGIDMGIEMRTDMGTDIGTDKKRAVNKMLRRKAGRLAGIFALCIMVLAGCGNSGQPADEGEGQGTAAGTAETSSETSSETDRELLSGKHHVNIHIQDKGVIAVELDADNAPISVTNFVNLARSGFYDGLTFHRIIDGFMMQGGDPLGTGTGGSENTIKGEFSQNGVENPLTHTRGAISMARSMQMDSASSQFFIVHQDTESLDGSYAVFGYVTEGMDIVDDICENTTGQDANGVVPNENRPVIEKIEVID